ncbi:MAG TPA: hypothetical protein VMP01_10855 [Pirellulaceae bacterium]|nr:hypothetical protein [Pirellulaceae bacterium]
MLGTLLTIWTIRLSLAAYALWLGMLLVPSGKLPPGSRLLASRWLYTLACGLFLAHVVCAFQFYHHWSHQSALDDTARQTDEMLGFAFGEGIYFSYLFTLLWVADVAWLWLWPQHRPAWLTAVVQLYLAFIALNGAIVFEAGITRWVGIPVAAVLVGLAVWRFANPQSAIRNPQ